MYNVPVCQVPRYLLLNPLTITKKKLMVTVLIIYNVNYTVMLTFVPVDPAGPGPPWGPTGPGNPGIPDLPLSPVLPGIP